MPFDPLGLAWVLLGSIAIATLQCGWSACAAAIHAAIRMHRICPAKDAADAEAMMKVARTLTKRSGLWSLDQLVPKNAVMVLLHNHLLSQHAGPELIRRMRQTLLAADQKREDAIRWWLALADAAPALGMAGTIFGMIRLFGQPQTAAGSPLAATAHHDGIALALYTTFYGLIVASIIAGPIAQRLAHLARAEAIWQRRMMLNFIGLARASGSPAGPVSQ